MIFEIVISEQADFDLRGIFEYIAVKTEIAGVEVPEIKVILNNAQGFT